MAILKCKMCGGSLDVSEGATVVECEYCGTKQTLPKSSDENIQSLFNRANLLRQKNEFDKAEAIYEKILTAADSESEAYWGVILCKFGIEYVEDPKTFKRIPTCHRSSYDSVIADEYYKKAIEYADEVQKAVYEAEARAIDEIQKGILAISSREEPYDVFICYKETDESGKRTQDSVIANDIYYQLTNVGYKVFYAAITLEDKLGSAYEPIIFAALNSSKVMLAIGTKADYFNAVWVKNEWSRFLKMMKNDRSKLLIPCYRDMDAYELPEEFSHLQAQDMSKIGFINDIVRGIAKLIVKDEPKPSAVIKETVVTTGGANVEALLKRAFLALEDKEWDKADGFCEQALNSDPENAQAYLGKLLAEAHASVKSDLKNRRTPLRELKEYNKLMRFADNALKEELEGYEKDIDLGNASERKDEALAEAKSLMDSQSIAELEKAISRLRSISGWKDADECLMRCYTRIDDIKDRRYKEAYEKADQLENTANNSFFTLIKAVKEFERISDYRDAADRAESIRSRIPSLIERIMLVIQLFLAVSCVVLNIISFFIQHYATLILFIISLSLAILWYAVSFKTYHPKYVDIASIAIYLTSALVYLADWESHSDYSIAIICLSIVLIALMAVRAVLLIVKKKGLKRTVISGASALSLLIALVCVFSNPFCYDKCEGGYEVTGYKLFAKEATIPESHLGKSVVAIADFAFSRAFTLEKITVPSSVKNIGNSAFFSCYRLNTVELSEGVTEIESEAFAWCSELESIVIPSSVKVIHNAAFYGCSSLTSVTLNEGLTNIEHDAFEVCSSLTNITFPSSLMYLEGAFECCPLTSVEFKDPDVWQMNDIYHYPPTYAIPAEELSDTAKAAVIVGSMYGSWSYSDSLSKIS